MNEIVEEDELGMESWGRLGVEGVSRDEGLKGWH